MESKVIALRRQLDELCLKIDERIRELGDTNIMTYRSDPLIKDLRSKICQIYRESVNMCKTYKEAVKVCETFKEYPECLTQLMLSEELVCPVTKEEIAE